MIATDQGAALGFAPLLENLLMIYINSALRRCGPFAKIDILTKASSSCSCNAEDLCLITPLAVGSLLCDAVMLSLSSLSSEPYPPFFWPPSYPHLAHPKVMYPDQSLGTPLGQLIADLGPGTLARG